MFEKILRGRGGRNRASWRSLAGLIAIAMCAVCTLSLGSGSIGEVKAAESDFEIDDEGYITGYSGSDDEVVIPSEIDGEPIIGIKMSAFTGNFSSVIIPDGLSEIEPCAFYEIPSLVKVTFLGSIPDYMSGVFMALENENPVTFYCYREYKDDLEDALEYDEIEYEIICLDGGTEEPDTPDIPVASSDFTADGGTLTKYTGNVENGVVTTITIPAQINGNPVTVIGKDAFNNKFLRLAQVTVVLPDTVTTIEEGAFRDCPGLVSINFPSGLTSIGRQAFMNCEKLGSISLPEGLTTIGDGAFQSCHGLTSVSIPASANVTLTTDMTTFAFSMCGGIKSFAVTEGNVQLSSKDGVLYDKAGTTLVAYPLGKEAKSFDIPDGVTTIANSAFKRHQMGPACALNSVSFPSSLKKIEKNAFQAQNLTTITITGNIECETGVFQLNSSLKTVNVAEGVTEITDMLFYGLEKVETVNLPSTLERIGKRAFDRCGASEIKLPSGLKSIGEEAFECSKLQSVEIPANVTNIGDRAFYNCNELTELKFKKGFAPLNLGRYTFNSCDKLNQIDVPDRVTMLNDGVFSKMPALTDITLPDSIVTLGDNVFASSDALETVELPDSITTMGNCTFKGCSALTNITLPANLARLGTCTFEMIDGGNFSLTEVIIPDSVKITTIPSDTFWGREGIKELELPAVIAGTEACAFSKCSDDLEININRAESEFRRSRFDCFDFDGAGLNGYWDGDAYVYQDNGAGIDQDHSNNANKEFEEKSKQNALITASLDGASLKSRSSASAYAVCGCATGVGGRFTASATPTFKYKKTTSSSSVAGVTGNNGTANGNSASTKVTGSSGKSGGSAKTGDVAPILAMVMLLALSGLYLTKRYRNTYRR